VPLDLREKADWPKALPLADFVASAEWIATVFVDQFATYRFDALFELGDGLEFACEAVSDLPDAASTPVQEASITSMWASIATADQPQRACVQLLCLPSPTRPLTTLRTSGSDETQVLALHRRVEREITVRFDRVEAEPIGAPEAQAALAGAAATPSPSWWQRAWVQIGAPVLATIVASMILWAILTHQ
jgi:hypothetical protein